MFIRTCLKWIYAYNEQEFIPWQSLYYRICHGNNELDWGCPNGTNTPRGDNFSRYQNLHCDLDLWPFDLKIYRAHHCLMGSLHVKFHDDRCKGKAVMHRKPFSVIYALWPWPLTSKSIGHILASWRVCMWSFMMIGVKGKQLCAGNHFQ